MIFVTVGMHTQGFNRLLKKLDEIADTLDEEVIMQIGHTDFRPVNTKWFDFCTEAEIKGYCKKARVVVTHPAMSVLDSLEQGTPVIVVPRMKMYNEVIDDHQVDFAKELEKQGKVTVVYEIEALREALQMVGHVPQKMEKDKRLIKALKYNIDQYKPD